MEFTALSDLARNGFCVMATNAASEQVYNIARPVVNSRRGNLKSSSVNNMLYFNSALKTKKEAFTVD